MDIILYNCSNKRNRIDKTVENGLTVTGTMRGALNYDVVNVQLEHNVAGWNYNYCYIPDLKRYYFIGTPVILPNGVITIPLTCDVLMSFKTAIESIVGTVGRQENPNKYYSGYDTNHDVRPTVEKYEFENNFNTDGNIIMVTIRGE